MGVFMLIMRHCLRGCGIHLTPGDNSGGHLGLFSLFTTRVVCCGSAVGCVILCHIIFHTVNTPLSTSYILYVRILLVYHCVRKRKDRFILLFMPIRFLHFRTEGCARYTAAKPGFDIKVTNDIPITNV